MKDFYDFDAYRYGQPDDSLVWKRKQETIELTETLKKKINSLVYSRYCVGIDGWYGSKERKYIIWISQCLVGIYPKIYWLPKIHVDTVDRTSKFLRYHCIQSTVIPPQDARDILCNDVDIKEWLDSEGIDSERCYIPYAISGDKSSLYTWQFKRNHRILTDPYIVEDPEIFKETKSPVFHAILHDEPYIRNISDRWELNRDATLISIEGLLTHYPEIKNERDIYTDIENFLWSMKQEPMPEPDNNTKIVSAGFDTKTSFRNM